jgi:hypothetical protein
MKEERTSRFGYFSKLKRIDGVVFMKELQVSSWFFPSILIFRLTVIHWNWFSDFLRTKWFQDQICHFLIPGHNTEMHLHR